MKKLNFFIFFLIWTSLLFAACSKVPETNDVSGDVQVQLPVLQKDGSYILQVHTLKEISNLKKMSGHFAQFLYHPKFENGAISGEQPQAKFVKSWDGTYIPADDTTLQLASIYMHAQNLALLDAEFGIVNLNSWPLKVGVAVGINDGGVKVRNNSFYDGEADAILFVPYTAQDLPIAVNGGIIAHEHFHSFFYKLVFQPLSAQGKLSMKFNTTIHDQSYFRRQVGLAAKPIAQNTDQVVSENMADEKVLRDCYNTVLFKGMNEGFADFWGWVYTGNADFITPSLVQEKHSRSLNYNDDEKQSPYLFNENDLKNQIKLYLADSQAGTLENSLNGMAYRLGTQLSRFLKAYTDIYAKERSLSVEQARKEIAKILITSLSTLRDKFSALSTNQNFTPADFIKLLKGNLPETKKSECVHFKKYLPETKCEQGEPR